MTGFPGSPRTIRGGLVLLDPASGAIRRVVALQYNPDSLSRTLRPKDAGDDPDLHAVRRLTGPPAETIALEAELDATDRLEFPDANPATVAAGLHSDLAVLESLLYPASADVLAADALAERGALEILPAQGPLVLLVWGRRRVVPVRLTDLSVTEDAFDATLNPIRATVSLTFTVLTVNELGVGSRGGAVAMTHHRRLEELVGSAKAAGLRDLGLESLP